MNKINTDLLESVLDPENMNRAWKRVPMHRDPAFADQATLSRTFGP